MTIYVNPFVVPFQNYTAILRYPRFSFNEKHRKINTNLNRMGTIKNATINLLNIISFLFCFNISIHCCNLLDNFRTKRYKIYINNFNCDRDMKDRVYMMF